MLTAIFSYFRALFGPEQCAEGAQTIPTPTTTITQPRYHSQCSSYGPKCSNEPNMSQKVPKTAKYCIFEVFSSSTFLDFSQLLGGSRTSLTPPRASPFSKESKYLCPFFMKIKSRKVITALMSINDFASHRAAQNVYTSSSPGLKPSGALRPFSFL